MLLFINLGGLQGDDKNKILGFIFWADFIVGITYSLSLSIVKSDKSSLLEYEYDFKEKSELPIGSLPRE